MNHAADEGLAPRFPVLDTLRAVGALAVLTTHVAFYSGDYSRHGVLGALLARLDVGVALFFVLTGFLLARPYLARAALGHSRPSTGTYYLKRILRIYPVYVVAVVVGMLALEENSGLGLRDWLVTLALLNTFVDPLPPAGLSQMWSLGVEVSFYIVLPGLMLLATGRRGLRPARVVAVLLAGLALTVWWHLDGAARAEALTNGPALQWLPAYLSWFAVGIGLALIHVRQTTGNPSRIGTAVLHLGRQPGVCWVLAAALLLVSATPLAGPTTLNVASAAESLTKNLLYAAVAGLVVLTGVVAEPTRRFGTLLGSAAARRLGLVSYSLFSLHLVLVDRLADALDFPLFGGNGVQLWLATVAVSLLAAELAYRFVELPGIRLRGVLSRRPAAEAATATRGTTQR